MLAMSAVGLDGCTLSWVDYELGISQYAEQIHPLLVQTGLRAAIPSTA
jgi:dimethylsulfone monooxygenase